MGFTARRLAKRLLLRRAPVFGVARNMQRFGSLAAIGLRLSEFKSGMLPRNAVLIYSIPPLEEPENGALRSFVSELNPWRIVYISATSVYGSQFLISAETEVQPADEKGRRRIEEERWVESGPWSSLILRAAAIYGPGRGVHASLRGIRSDFLATDRVHRIVSRIHVDDLARLAEMGALSDLRGAWPVADEQAAPSAEVASWAARLRNICLPSECTPLQAGFSPSGRLVDGTKICELLGIELAYKNYEAGILASLAEEKQNLSPLSG